MREIEQTGDAKRGVQAIATNYYGVGGNGAMIHHVHLQWDNAFAGVFTFETSDFPELTDVTVAGNPGDWIPECAFSVASVVGGTVASSATTPATPASVTVVATNPGGASLNFALSGAKTMRVKVVCTAQGSIRIRSHGKF